MNFYLDLTNNDILVSLKPNSSLEGKEGFKTLKANSVDAAKEKHVPVVSVEGDTVNVTVGSVKHPMTPEHLITHVILETTKGYQVKALSHECEPVVTFKLCGCEKPVAVYEYCNLHGLWVANI